MATVTFDQLELSIEDGRPIEFYRFILGGLTWYYTTADQDQQLLGQTWISAKITAESIKQTGEYVNDVLTIDVPSGIAPAQLFMTAAPSASIQIAIGTKHIGVDEIIVGYMGEVRQVNFPLPGRARMSCESLMSTMKREGLRLGWQRSCPYVLYDPLTCRVDKELWKVALTVLAIDGFTLEIELEEVKDDGYFDGGFIEWQHPIRDWEFLPVDTHDNTVTIDDANARVVLGSVPGELFEGATGFIYPGCNFTPANCQAFDNYDNYGGVPDMPGKSPFDGDPVF